MRRKVRDEFITGLNAPPKKTKHVRCSRCDYVLDVNKHARGEYGSRLGQGVTHTSALTYESSRVYNLAYGYNGYEVDFEITGGCPFCGVFTYDQEERRHRG